MCGIFGVVGENKKVAKTVLAGLKKLEYRGYDSWGIVINKNDQLIRERHIGKIGQAETKLPDSSIGLGHTRWATHGGVTTGNAHPHLSCNKKLSLVHNGIVENYRQIKTKLKNHQFQSETDTEVALHLIEEKLKKLNFKKAVQSAFKEVSGMNAFILLSADHKELIAVKNGSPLTIGLGKNFNLISSDVWALLDHTNKVIFLEDNQLARITKNQVQVFNAQTGKKINPKITTLNWQKQQSHLGNFHHYMEKEIFDQPKVLDNLARLDKHQLSSINLVIKKAHQVYLLGCGTAYYAALFGEYLFGLSGKNVESIVGSEFSKNKVLLSSSKAFIMLSQSGETIDVVEAVNLAQKSNIKIIGITNVLGSTLYRKANQNILLQAGQEVAVASTKAFTAKLCILIQLESMLDGSLEQTQKLLTKAAKSVTKLCAGKPRQEIKNLAKNLKDKDHMFVIGRLLSYPIALETALKIKEVSYIHAEGYAGGELKHGPIALIEKDTPCIVIAPNDNTYTDQISATHEMKARGGYIIGISPTANPVFDVHLQVPDLKQATAIPVTVIAQLLAYDLAVARGLNPDKPRNLAKSVTVK